MVQQNSQPSRLRKDFLVIGIVLLILGFVFFFWAGSFAYDMTTQRVSVENIADANYYYPYQFGTVSEIVLSPVFVMQPNDYLTISYAFTQTNGTVYMTIWGAPTANDIQLIKYSSSPFIDFRNERDSQVVIEVKLGAQNKQNILSVTTTLHHYLRPDWLFFGIGVVLSSLALIPIFESKRQA